MYEYMATRTLHKIIDFFEHGQEVVLHETTVEHPEPEEDEVHLVDNWDTLKSQTEGVGIEKLLEVGIGAGADDSEWYRLK